jgi:sugar phosphate isomerase/epimerase
VLTALSTVSRDLAAPAAFAARAARLGFRDVALDGSLEAGSFDVLVPAVLSSGLRVVAVEAPCPRPSVRRPPALASSDREERRAAVRAFEATLDTAAQVDARLVIVQLGVLEIRHGWAETARAYARATLDDEAREKIVETRRRVSARALDLARFGLDPVLARAADAGVTVGLVNRSRWFEIPSATEVARLLADFAGGPLKPFYDPAAAHIRAALGLGAGRPTVEIERAAGAYLVDAAGLRGGLPWGTGEVDRAFLDRLPAAAPRILRSALATDEELLLALAGG